MTEDRYRR